jgi:UDP-glucose 4-epimerase
MKNDKILVTGGAGYIGSHTVVRLIEEGYTNIVSIDNYMNSDETVYDRIREVTGVSVQYACIDLRQPDEIDSFFQIHTDIRGIIHFAALKSVPESVADPMLYFENNITGLLNLLSAVKTYSVSSFIFSSSCSIYGDLDKMPVTEHTPPGVAASPYAYTKQVGERILEDFARVTPSVKVTSLRYFNPVGAHLSGLLGEIPRQRPNNLVPVITQTAAGIIPALTVFGKDYPTRDGTCIRDYIHVMDIADAHVIALERLFSNNQELPCEVYNLGTGNGVSVLEAIRAFEKVSGVQLNYMLGDRREGDVITIYSDNTLVEKELGWKTRFGLDEMMSSAWKWQLHYLGRS